MAKKEENQPVANPWQNVTNSNGDKSSPVEEKKEEPKKALNKEEVVQKAFDFIKDFEGCHLTAYWDVNHYSIWYWTRSFAGEQITQEEAEKRSKEYISWIIDKWGLMKLDNEWMIVAFSSFAYNTWRPPKNYQRYLDNGYINWLKNFMKQHSYAWWKRLRWLAKRRQAEVDLF